MATNKSQSASQVYLLAYNTICAGLWLYVLLGTAAALIFSPDISAVYASLEPWTRCVQTLAVAEIMHAASGLIRSPVFTTFTQVFARSVQVWGVNYAFPDTTGPSLAYPAMLLAWATADTIRYSYFAIALAGYPVPRALKWLRYSLFMILYPIGISSEWWLMLQATKVTENMPLAALYAFFLGLYLPGSVMMYSYMFKQRRKVLARE
ncbi:hypothetical protein PENANT_c028G01999 [Penicillium antarcticum]|uniref:Very-long-chain (3R)-3-hydroxyacyl-CoA dehydratase n=1 Tax=Penicillium antarcticum TaxID=416450 RepID=A0A1V6PWD5_9EURO|nr:uncharacterized protein N7508_009080 [Penicillium antarcticum]KAJ5294259.1 hypothetical protein N7508_009080 [Penicillium antarcticum]OQD81273.1 hypothetical protein PENANT_c028G01999 [Penicillium antarcticum]